MLDPIKETQSNNLVFQSIIDGKTTELLFIRPAPRLILSEDTLKLCLPNHIASAESILCSTSQFLEIFDNCCEKR
jgi:hypothetical protein